MSVELTNLLLFEMLDFLLSSIDSSRGHDVGVALSWHGRFMVFAWGVLIPLGVIAVRFFKVVPGQDWPREVQNPFWFISHRVLQYSGLALMIAAIISVFISDQRTSGALLHRWLGWSIFALAALQYFATLAKGTGGGPKTLDANGEPMGDHFNMTRKRVVFEWLHKNLGYLTLGLSVVSILTGLWISNAPIWMWIGQIGWWCLIVVLFVYLQKQGRAIDTYQAIWGTDPELPGNKLPPIGWGIRRGSPLSFEKTVSIRERRRRQKGKSDTNH